MQTADVLTYFNFIFSAKCGNILLVLPYYKVRRVFFFLKLFVSVNNFFAKKPLQYQKLFENFLTNF